MTWLRHADAPAGCLFCRVAKASADRRDLVLARREHALLMLNRYPYASAHVMVAVKRHAGQFCELSPGERADLLELTALRSEEPRLNSSHERLSRMPSSA